MGNDRKKSQKNYRKGFSTSFNGGKKGYKTKEKDGFVIRKGTVIESYSNARFLIELDDIDFQVKATLAGKLRQNCVRILTGDRVELELSVYDTTQGRITRRL